MSILRTNCCQSIDFLLSSWLWSLEKESFVDLAKIISPFGKIINGIVPVLHDASWAKDLKKNKKKKEIKKRWSNE